MILSGPPWRIEYRTVRTIQNINKVSLICLFDKYEITNPYWTSRKNSLEVIEQNSPLFSYAEFVWGDKNNACLMSQLQVLQNKAAKIVLDMPMCSSATEALDKLGWKSLEKIRLIHRLTMAFKYLHGHIDIDLDVKLNRNVHSHNTRRRTGN